MLLAAQLHKCGIRHTQKEKLRQNNEPPKFGQLMIPKLSTELLIFGDRDHSAKAISGTGLV